MPIYKMQGKKDGRQKYRVRINYKNAMGEDKQMDRVAYGYDEAKQLEQRLSEDIKEKPPESRMTVQGLYDDYLAAKKYEVREASIYKTSCILKNHVLSICGDKRLEQLNLKVLQKWKAEIEEKKLSFTMRKNIFAEFRAMLNYGVKFDHLNANPLNKLGNFKDAYDTAKQVDYYTSQDFLKFIAASRKRAEAKGFFEWNYYVFFNIAFYTGLRKGEIYALKWSDIEGDLLHVRRSITQKMKGPDRETPPKNKSSFRSLQIPIPLKTILEEHRRRYAVIENFCDDWRVCGGVQCLRDSTISNHNAAFSQEAEIKKIRIHDFRHSHASLLANEGINIQEIARRLGHSKIEITWNTYSHLYPREEERALQILNKIV